ncbi:ABC transporter ATP-binding protein [Azospirillum soli]|uniref:ABC transporter ATP-binding protein n=1 Tax=Azospirillum soli TaxID=1304799 RepID=UPI001AEAB24B|nr:ABC transporter ATP-binding protein [Azospirillum soli]MBP2314366.1 ABC-type bacteriocin/lantibiotic exporter with double-glycine peptidase domain [Azospirillum soli]
MLPIIRQILGFFRPFWKPLALIAALIMMQRAGDLLLPFIGGRVIDAMAAQAPFEVVQPLILSAFLFWICHGNVLPYLLGRVDLAGFQYAAPRRLGVTVLGHVLADRRRVEGRDTALQQAVIERGEAVLVQFVNSLARVAIPVAVPGVVALGLLLWWYPLIGLIAVAGGTLDVLATIYLNKVLKPLYTRLQELDYARQRVHTRAFRHLLSIVVEGKQRDTVREYDARFGDFAAFGAFTGKRFLAFNFGRGIIVNVTNLCTWVVGAWYVHQGEFTLGYFLASLSWSTYVLNGVGAGIDLQKQWMETMPAIRAFVAELDACGAPVKDAAGAEVHAPALAPALGAE